MKWHLGIVAWIADAIKRKAELNENNSIDARLGKIEERLTKIEKSSIPIALFASGVPIYAIGFAGSLKNAMEATSIEWINFTYLFVGSILVTFAMKRHTGRNRDSFITIAITFGVLVIITIINFIRTL